MKAAAKIMSHAPIMKVNADEFISYSLTTRTLFAEISFPYVLVIAL